MDIIKAVEQEQLRTDLPVLSIGDFVKVHLKIKEGNRERIQIFEGTVIAIKGAGLRETFTVRRVSYGVGVERILPVHSPKINKIEVVRKGMVRNRIQMIPTLELNPSIKYHLRLHALSLKNPFAG